MIQSAQLFGHYQLRNIILKGTAKVELTLRSRFAYLLASDGNAYTYMDPESYQSVRSKRGELLRDNLLRNMSKWMGMSNEVCMRHYRRKGGPVPVWAAVETFPFDTLSRMLSLHADARALRELYRSVGLHTNLRTSSEVVHAMVYLRNLCSHHARLWHREMVIPSPMTRDMKTAFADFELRREIRGIVAACAHISCAEYRGRRWLRHGDSSLPRLE